MTNVKHVNPFAAYHEQHPITARATAIERLANLLGEFRDLGRNSATAWKLIKRLDHLLKPVKPAIGSDWRPLAQVDKRGFDIFACGRLNDDLIGHRRCASLCLRRRDENTRGTD